MSLMLLDVSTWLCRHIAMLRFCPSSTILALALFAVALWDVLLMRDTLSKHAICSLPMTTRLGDGFLG